MIAFPYYIVRFKPGRVYVVEPDGSLFPYYIVRFKPATIKI